MKTVPRSNARRRPRSSNEISPKEIREALVRKAKAGDRHVPEIFVLGQICENLRDQIVDKVREVIGSFILVRFFFPEERGSIIARVRVPTGPVKVSKLRVSFYRS